MLLPLLMQLGMLGRDTHDAGAIVFTKKPIEGESQLQATEDRKRILRKALVRQGASPSIPPTLQPVTLGVYVAHDGDDDEEAMTLLLLA